MQQFPVSSKYRWNTYIPIHGTYTPRNPPSTHTNRAWKRHSAQNLQSSHGCRRKEASWRASSPGDKCCWRVHMTLRTKSGGCKARNITITKWLSVCNAQHSLHRNMGSPETTARINRVPVGKILWFLSLCSDSQAAGTCSSAGRPWQNDKLHVHVQAVHSAILR